MWHGSKWAGPVGTQRPDKPVIAGNGVNALWLMVEEALVGAGLCAYIPAQL